MVDDNPIPVNAFRYSTRRIEVEILRAEDNARLQLYDNVRVTPPDEYAKIIRKTGNICCLHMSDAGDGLDSLVRDHIYRE